MCWCEGIAGASEAGVGDWATDGAAVAAGAATGEAAERWESPLCCAGSRRSGGEERMSCRGGVGVLLSPAGVRVHAWSSRSPWARVTDETTWLVGSGGGGGGE